jgi:hypothetical protein
MSHENVTRILTISNNIAELAQWYEGMGVLYNVRKWLVLLLVHRLESPLIMHNRSDCQALPPSHYSTPHMPRDGDSQIHLPNISH